MSYHTLKLLLILTYCLVATSFYAQAAADEERIEYLVEKAERARDEALIAKRKAEREQERRAEELREEREAVARQQRRKARQEAEKKKREAFFHYNSKRRGYNE
ncbi:MAG: hypothetical protein GC137_10820 [Alphaproteobacteria bacterium]|nr:hypothetical protein [Alphaproteobacteria bacterium]